MKIRSLSAVKTLEGKWLLDVWPHGLSVLPMLVSRQLVPCPHTWSGQPSPAQPCRTSQGHQPQASTKSTGLSKALWFLLFLKNVCPCHVACENLFPRPGIKPMTFALGALSLKHWTAREVPATAVTLVRDARPPR